jgi:hypothetical protein
MATQPKVGDTITVLGAAGQYNGTVQLKNATLLLITAAAGDDNTGDDNTGDEPTDEPTQEPTDSKEVTIPEAKAEADGTLVTVTGTVQALDGAWNAQFKNVTVILVDAEGNTLKVYRLTDETGEIGVGDVIKVTGKMATYPEGSTSRQIAQGATAEMITKHVCAFDDATCMLPKTCPVCNATEGEALGHNYVDGVCDREGCGAEAPAEGVTITTVSKTIAELITSEGWTGNTTKQSFNLDDVVSVKVNGGSNSGKAYNGDHIRIYATDSPAGTLTISVAEGYELVSIKITTQTGTYAYFYVDGTTTDICNKLTEVSGSSVVLNSVKNGDDGKQVRVTAIEVTYQNV